MHIQEQSTIFIFIVENYKPKNEFSIIYCTAVKTKPSLEWSDTNLEERLELRRREPVALLDVDVPLQERARGDAPDDELDRDHGALPRQESDVAQVLDKVGLDSDGPEKLEDLARGQRGEAGLALELVGLGAAERGETVLGLDEDQVVALLDGEDLLGLALG